MLLHVDPNRQQEIRRAYSQQSIEGYRKNKVIKIMFDRLIEEDQNYKHITRKYIHF